MLRPRLACHWNLPEGSPLRKYTDSTSNNRVSKVASPHLTYPISWLTRSRRPDSDLPGGPHSSCPSFPLFYRSPYLWNTNHSLLDICFLSFFLSFFFLSHLHRDMYNDHWWNSDCSERKWIKTHHLILLIMNHSFCCVCVLCPHMWVNVCVPYICKASQLFKLHLWTPAFMANHGKGIDSDYNGGCGGGSVLVIWEDFPNHSFSHFRLFFWDHYLSAWNTLT